RKGAAFSSRGRVRHVSSSLRRLSPSRFGGAGSTAVLSEASFPPKRKSFTVLALLHCRHLADVLCFGGAPSSRLTGIVAVNVDPQDQNISAVTEHSGENVREITRGHRGVHSDYFEPAAHTTTGLRLSRVHRSTPLDS
ncbi:unnamed protein product, partial [Ascophyllum nodosum]